MTRATLLAALIALATPGHAEETHVLRVATIVPDGTGWARTVRAFARDVSDATHGALQLKLYFGGIAGDEIEELERVKRQQLDGVISGGMLCERLSPTFRVMRVPGLFQSRDENAYVLGRLKPEVDREFLEAGMVHLGSAGVGASILFTRQPIATLAELRKRPLWVWDIDDVLRAYLPAMGLNVRATPIYQAARAYEDGQVDGFITPPTAMLGFQWSALVKYFTPLKLSYVSACVFVSSRVFDALPNDERDALRAATARFQARSEQVGRDTDEQLLGGLFQKQGIAEVPVSPSVKAELFDVAHRAREQVGGRVVRAEVLQRVLGLLADFRASR